MRDSLNVLSLAFIMLICLQNTATASTAISTLGSATSSNSFDNADYGQTWTWNSLSSDISGGLYLTTNSTSAANQTLFNVLMSGAISTSTQVSGIAGKFQAEHSGSHVDNYGIVGIAGSGGDHNYGVQGELVIGGGEQPGDAGVWGSSENVSGAYGVYGTSSSSTGYAGYFDNSGGGYAAAFIGGTVGIGTATPLALLHNSGGLTSPAWGASGINYRQDAATYTDNSSSAGTVTNNMVNAIAQPTLTTSTNTVTYTNAATLYIANAPAAGSHVTITNPYALDVAAGASYFGGGVTIISPSGANGISITSASGYDGVDFTYAGNVSNAITSRDTTGGTGAQTSIYFERNGSFVGTITTTNVATNYNTSSDKRLKENFKPISNSGDIIDSLNPVRFDWKYVDGHPSGYGVLAQDAYKALPDAIVKGDDGPVDGKGHVAKQWFVDYSKFVPILLAEVKSLRQNMGDDAKAIQELKADNDNLHKQLAADEAEIATLKKAKSGI